MIEVTAYEADSGNVYAHASDAKADDARHDLFKVLEEECVGSGGEWSRTMFYDTLVKRAADLVPLLQALVPK